MNIHGYAIVCRHDCIADAHGRMPRSLMNDADWAYFQDELDRSTLVVIGRLSHEATPNVKGRRRLIISRAGTGLEQRQDGLWWNPEQLNWSAVVDELKLSEARIAVPGGQGAFDCFLRIGFSTFHLSRAERVAIPDGRTLFGSISPGHDADTALRGAGLVPSAPIAIDKAADVSLTVYRRAKQLNAAEGDAA